MTRRYWLTAIFLGLMASPAAHAEILTVFSDQGVPGTPSGFNPIIVFSGGAAVFLGTSTAVSPPPEGFTSFQVSENVNSFAGWGVQFKTPQNLSRFNSGEFRFWVYSSTGNVAVQILDSSGNLLLNLNLLSLGWNWATMHNQWLLMRVPLTGINLTGVKTIQFSLLQGPSTFYTDNVHFIDSTAAPNFTVTIKNRSNDAAASQVVWTSPAAAWTLADQYLSVETDSTVLSWGVQIYTNNTLPAANPQYTGLVSTFTATPAGLVDESNTAIAPLPMAWDTRSDVSTVTVVAADPNSGTPDSFQWLYMEDHAQVAVAVSSAAAFSNGDNFIVTRNNFGIHFSQKSTDFGAADPPYRIYLEGDFRGSLAQQTYQTSTLTLELFYL